MIRRQFLSGAAALAATSPTLLACSSGAAQAAAAARKLRHPGAGAGDPPPLLRELVRYATLAASSHNTQCWKFDVQEARIRIEPDRSRRCPVVDPDDHHQFVSLGCAAENLAHAALSHGLQADASFDAEGTGAVSIDLAATSARSSPSFLAIAERQCTRGDFDGRPLAAPELRLLQRAGSGHGVNVLLLSERAATEKVLEYVVAGNTAQMNDRAFIAELQGWIRFNGADAVRTGDGLFSGASGNPALPRWLGLRLMDLFFTPKSENERYARQIRNAAGIAIFVSDVNDKAHWVEAGRCYQRFALQATALGIRNAFLNQPVEVGSIRPAFAAALGLGPLRPDLVVRFGRGPTLPFSLRRAVQAVLL